MSQDYDCRRIRNELLGRRFRRVRFTGILEMVGQGEVPPFAWLFRAKGPTNPAWCLCGSREAWATTGTTTTATVRPRELMIAPSGRLEPARD
jgi:hypothetical protein